MAEHIGKVIQTEPGKYARVVTNRMGACGGCQSTPHGCQSCQMGTRMESRVANPIGAVPGDLVKVHMSTTGLFTGAAMLYLLPILGLKECFNRSFRQSSEGLVAGRENGEWTVGFECVDQIRSLQGSRERLK